MAKQMKSFRLDEDTCIDLAAHAEAFRMSQAELIELLVQFGSDSGLFDGFDELRSVGKTITKRTVSRACKDDEIFYCVKGKVFCSNSR